jgi:ABC-type uncharacterized transport system auxiliary subunit
MKKTLYILALLATLAACTTSANKNDVCHEEGGERDQREVCVKK